MTESLRIIQKTNISDRTADNRIQRAVDGDKSAFSELVLEIENKLYRISRSVLKNDADCADAIQEALIRAWINLPKLKDYKLFEHWLIRIVLRECYRIAKKKKFEPLYDNDTASYRTNIDDMIAIESAIYHLDINKRVPFVLHYIEGYKVREISKIIHIPEGTVKSRLLRARNEMREMLKEENYDK